MEAYYKGVTGYVTVTPMQSLHKSLINRGYSLKNFNSLSKVVTNWG